MSIVATEVSFKHGASINTDPRLALEELDQKLSFKDCQAAILYVSAQYDLEALKKEIEARFDIPLLCCTTAGEISSEHGYTNGGMAAATISGCEATLIEFSGISKGEQSINAPLAEAQRHLANCETAKSSIGLLVVDGLCGREESLIELLQTAMPTIPIVGGSAGDECKFLKTLIFVNGRFQSDAAALLILSGEFSAIPFQTHHFTSSGIRVVATEVDVPNRRVLRLDGMPAATRLAEIVGCTTESLTIDRLATKPLMLRFGDVYFVRSVRVIEPDGAILLFCAINEGEILHLGKSGEITDITAAYFDALGLHNSTPDLVLGFDCILRRLELSLKGMTSEINKVVKSVPFVGFSTFGEQYNGQHVNQTMTGVALWKR